MPISRRCLRRIFHNTEEWTRTGSRDTITIRPLTGGWPMQSTSTDWLTTGSSISSSSDSSSGCPGGDKTKGLSWKRLPHCCCLGRRWFGSVKTVRNINIIAAALAAHTFTQCRSLWPSLRWHVCINNINKYTRLSRSGCHHLQQSVPLVMSPSPSNRRNNSALLWLSLRHHSLLVP